MKESIHRYFHLGTIQWMSHPPAQYPLLDSLRSLACDAELDTIEVTHIADEETRAKAKRILQQSHMRVCYGAQPCLLGPKLNPNALCEQERLQAENALLSCIDEAHELGAGGVAFLAGKWQEETKEEAFEQLLKTTRSLCAHAAKYGMMIELEVFDYDMDKAALIGPAPLARRFAQEMRKTCGNFGLIVDLSHFPTTYETSNFVVSTLREYITHFHIGNAVVVPGCEAYGDQHPRFGFPNSANDVNELCDFFRVLRREGFFRPEEPMVLSFEVKPWGDEDGDIILANTKRVIQRAWAMLEDEA